ncbi:MAG: DNA polymerase IV [Gammaproteobacteria bacterium]|nr:DNA polymerase IV [Gammaproteobacteria bacterium]
MIIHVDMDAFYASVEEREDPMLKGHPLIVGGQAGSRGVVSAANYAAREFGVFSAMPTSVAIRKCPHLKIIPPRGAFYSAVSKQIHHILNRYTPIIEPLSLDEAFLDPRGSEVLHGDAIAIGKKIKNDILNELSLVASVGVAPNKFLAKLASDHDKPDGFTVIKSDDVQNFMDAMPIDRLWGVGKSAKAIFARYQIETVAHLRAQSVEFLDTLFGQSGEKLWQLAHGIDSRVVVTDSEAKSISRENTFAWDIHDYDVVESMLMELVEGVVFRLREAELKGRTISIKIRFGDFKTITRSHTLSSPTDITNEIWATSQRLLRSVLLDRKFSIRLIGIGVSGFSDETVPSQTDIFDGENRGKQRQLDQLSDKIKKRYGAGTLKRGKAL